ncbi:peptidase T [Olsenella massiliensis]|uniref:peptidase T n=1 Tax=Olsenella massiliensis TaxID=1622075 RepID=UPI00071D16B1|nr:peptidase T [Olsenella massiliensis]
MRAYERLLRYAVVRTPSDADRDTTPTTACQFDLAKLLVEELGELGVRDVTLSDECFVYAKIPATPGLEDSPKLGLIAHMDTVSQFCDHDIVPVLHEGYDGGDLVLGDSGRTLTVKDFPHLPTLAGRTLITTDGTTILGADDKAGIAEIMTVLETLRDEGIAHGPLRVAFTPDEETGTGASHFDLAAFDADVAYTLDGDVEGQIQYQNFNACRAEFVVTGVSVHPGAAKDVMVNAAILACHINASLPAFETPRHTSGYEGFYHLLSIEGDEATAKVEYIVRDHDAASFAARKATLRHVADVMNERWGEGTVRLDIDDEYQNMESVIAERMYMIDVAKEAAERAGVRPDVSPIRGGTDGSQLSFRGLPCPNLGTGGHGFHGPYEHITVEGMDLAAKMALELVKLYGKRGNRP